MNLATSRPVRRVLGRAGRVSSRRARPAARKDGASADSASLANLDTMQPRERVVLGTELVQGGKAKGSAFLMVSRSA